MKKMIRDLDLQAVPRVEPCASLVVASGGARNPIMGWREGA
jgi:hypothetical protein